MPNFLTPGKRYRPRKPDAQAKERGGFLLCFARQACVQKRFAAICGHSANRRIACRSLRRNIIIDSGGVLTGSRVGPVFHIFTGAWRESSSMRRVFLKTGACDLAWRLAALYAFMAPQQAAQAPPPANHRIDFAKEIKPIFEGSCIECHGRGKSEGGFRIDTRETLLKGGDSGPAVIAGKSADSPLIELVASSDPDTRMPKKGSHLTSEQIGLLRAWIDQGAAWTAGISFGRLEPKNLKPRRPNIPAGPKEANPVDLFLSPILPHIRSSLGRRSMTARLPGEFIWT